MYFSGGCQRSSDAHRADNRKGLMSLNNSSVKMTIVHGHFVLELELELEYCLFDKYMYTIYMSRKW